MSAVPPNVPANLSASVLQSNLVARQAGHTQDAERAQKASVARQQATAADERDNTIGTGEGDMAVNSDGEGSGSQGRAFSNPEDQGGPSQDDPADDSMGDEGRHLDLQA